MDTSLIYQALEEPALRKQIPLAELERIQAAYPYFTAAQVLLAKIYQENKDHRYVDQLQQAALYAIDRKVLSEYMKENEEMGKWGNGETGKRESEEVGLSTGSRTGGNGEENVQNEPIRQAQGPPIRQAQGPFQNENEKRNENELRGESENEKVGKWENEEVTNQISGEYVFITDEELSIFEEKGSVKQNENENGNENELSRESEVGNQKHNENENELRGRDQSENENENELRGRDQNENENENSLRGEREEENQVEEKSARVEMSDFDREILIEAVQSSIELEVGERDQNQKQNENENELRGENEEEIRRIEAKDPSELTFGELMMLKAARMRTNENEHELRGRAQSEVGNQNDNQNENELRGENEDEDGEIRLSTNEERTEERGKNFDYLYKLHNGGLAPIDAPNEKEKQKSIIDRFIKLEPKITPGKVSEYNTASNLAKESLEEDFSFATETMAKLFIAQGKFDKAKKVYRKLMELHPEKNVYFAAQLKNLNQNKKQ